MLLKALIFKEKGRPMKNILLYFRNVDIIDQKQIKLVNSIDRNNQDFDLIKKQLNSIVEDYLKAC